MMTDSRNNWLFPVLVLALPLLLSVCHTPPNTPEPEPKPPRNEKPKIQEANFVDFYDLHLKLVPPLDNQNADVPQKIRLAGVQQPSSRFLVRPSFQNELIEGTPFPENERCRACLKAKIKERNSLLGRFTGPVQIVSEPEMKNVGEEVPFRYVFPRNRNRSINRILLEAGLARAADEYEYMQKPVFKQLEQNAREARKGIFGCMDPKPVTAYRDENEEGSEETAEDQKDPGELVKGTTQSEQDNRGSNRKERTKTDLSRSKRSRNTSKQKKIDQQTTSEPDQQMTRTHSRKTRSGNSDEHRTKQPSNEVEKSMAKQKKRRSRKKPEPDRGSSLDRETPTIYARGPAMNNHPKSKKTLDIQKQNETDQSITFHIQFPDSSSRRKCGWFMWRLDGVKGKRVKMILSNIGRYDNWKDALVPVYSQGVTDLSNPKAYQARTPGENALRYQETTGGIKVPVTNGLQKWHYFRDVRYDDRNEAIVLKKRFRQNRSYVAMRPPIPYAYIRNVVENTLRDHPLATVHDVGSSAEGRPLYVIEVGGGTKKDKRTKPCVLMYGKEHPDEQGSAAVVEGAISFLLSNQPEARRMRRKATFLFIPVLDPDGSVWNRYNTGICYTFEKGESSRESRAYARFFRNWLNKNYRLDVVYNLHNVEAAESGGNHLFNFLLAAEEKRRKNTRKLHHRVVQHIRKAGFDVRDGVSKKGYTFDRLAGWLQINAAGTRHMFYEVNSQADPKLSISRLRQMGAHMLRATVSFLYRPEASEFLARVERKRRMRQRLRKRYEPIYDRLMRNEPTAFHRELTLWFQSAFERSIVENRQEERKKGKQPEGETWADRLWRHKGRSKHNIPKVPDSMFR